MGSSQSQKPKKEEDDPNKGSRMLKTEEIREICEKHQLTRMEVYNIRSQFAGMCLMSKEDEQKELMALRAQQDGNKNKGKVQSSGNIDQEEETVGRARGADGIGLNFFKKNCSFLAGCLP